MDLQHWPLWVSCGLMVIAAIINYRTLMVPNWLSLPSIAVGLLIALLFGERLGGDWVSSLIGIGASLAFMIPMYTRYGLGAGSVKMQMGLGAWIGSTTSSEWSFFISASAAILGSLLTYIVLTMVGKREPVQENVDLPPKLYPAQITLTLGSLIAVIGLFWLRSMKLF